MGWVMLKGPYRPYHLRAQAMDLEASRNVLIKALCMKTMRVTGLSRALEAKLVHM